MRPENLCFKSIGSEHPLPVESAEKQRESAHEPYGHLVQASARVTVQKKYTAVGVIATGYPTWAWYVGALGEVKWIISGNELPGQMPTDPTRFSPNQVRNLEPVSVVLVQGDWSLVPAEVWEMDLDVLLLTGRQRKSRGKGRKNPGAATSNVVPNDWTEGSMKLDHSALGGVTNGVFWIEWAVPNSKQPPKFTQPVPIKSTIAKVLSSHDTDTYGRVGEPETGTLNSSKGLIHWKHRWATVTVPHLYDGSWVQRELSEKEKADALDFPNERRLKIEDEDMKGLLGSEVPGKVYYAAIHFLSNREARRPFNVNPDFTNKRRKLELGEATPLRSSVGLTTTGSEESGKRVVLPTPGGKRKRLNKTEPHLIKKTRFTLVSSGEAAGTLITRRRLTEPEAAVFSGIASDREDTLIELAVDLVTDKATKSDDAAVPEFLWDQRIAEGLMILWKKERRARLLAGRKESRTPFPLAFRRTETDWQTFRKALITIRRFFLQIWKRRVSVGFEAWFDQVGAKSSDAAEILADGRAACQQARKSTWWEWEGGSTIFFWRWPADYQSAVRVGVPPMFISDPPANQSRQPEYEDGETMELVKRKLMKVLDKGYIVRTDTKEITAFMFMFHVPKGESDVRIVYDGSRSGLNETIYAPWFALPTVNSMARGLIPGDWLADNDYGEQFLNFPLHPELQKYCGVDLTQLLPGELTEPRGMVVGSWSRSAMGLSSSPHNAVQGAQRAKRMILGDPKDPTNPFRWAKLVLNLPGSKGYNPTLPWIRKIRKDGTSASDLIGYVDDLRSWGASEDRAWRASSRIAKVLAFLGLQDAARKRRAPSQEPGAWAGSTIRTNSGVVTKGVTSERWETLQSKIRWIGREVGLVDEYTPDNFVWMSDKAKRATKPEEGLLHFKTTESCVGFIVYVSLTYTSLMPYLKGIYLSLNSWRPGRDAFGWSSAKLKEAARAEPVSDKLPKQFPEWIKPVPRLDADLKALMELTRMKEPPFIPMRATNPNAVFMVGDASGTGFGVSDYIQGENKIHAEYGDWTREVTENMSSNFRETANLVRHLERRIASGAVERGSEVFIFTDNSTAERTMFRGSSKSKLLHNMVLDLRRMEMHGDLIVHFVWISGTRMIAQGGDGLSRGDFSSGVMKGEDYLQYLPLHQSAFERLKGFQATVQGWCPNGMTGGKYTRWKIADPEDWFHEVFKDPTGRWIWCPPPALAKVAVEQLCEVKHVFPESRHLFLCPAVMTGVWRKQLLKQEAVHISLSSGSKLWPAEMFEPLTIVLIAPSLRHRPWTVSRSTRMEAWKNKMQGLSRNDKQAFRSGMRKFWDPPKSRLLL